MGEESETDTGTSAIALGSDETPPGAPIVRIADRFTYPIERSEVRDRAGEEVIRTPAGPVPLTDLLERIEGSYFGSRSELVEAVRSILPNRAATED